MESQYFQKISNLMRWCAAVTWCDCVVFCRKKCFCEMFVEWLLLNNNISLVRHLWLTMKVFWFYTASANWNKNKGQIFPQVLSFFKNNPINLTEKTCFFVHLMKFHFHQCHFLRKSFISFLKKVLFLNPPLSKAYKLMQHNQVLPVSSLTF